MSGSMGGSIIDFVLSGYDYLDLRFGEGQKAYIANLDELSRARSYARLQETDALRQGASEAGRLRMQGTALAGQQTKSYAMGSIDSTSGTAAQTMASSRIFSELEAATAMNNARREALGHKRTQEALDFKTLEMQRSYRNEVEKAKWGLVGKGLIMGEKAVQTGMSYGMGGA